MYDIWICLNPHIQFISLVFVSPWSRCPTERSILHGSYRHFDPVWYQEEGSPCSKNSQAWSKWYLMNRQLRFAFYTFIVKRLNWAVNILNLICYYMLLVFFFLFFFNLHFLYLKAGAEISTVHPEQYAKRFREFVTNIFAYWEHFNSVQKECWLRAGLIFSLLIYFKNII